MPAHNSRKLRNNKNRKRGRTSEKTTVFDKNSAATALLGPPTSGNAVETAEAGSSTSAYEPPPIVQKDQISAVSDISTSATLVKELTTISQTSSVSGCIKEASLVGDISTSTEPILEITPEKPSDAPETPSDVPEKPSNFPGHGEEIALFKGEPPPEASAATQVSIRFELDDIPWTEGETIKIVGSHDIFGNWDPDKGLILESSSTDVWHAVVKLSPPDEPILYKVVRTRTGAPPIWEACDNQEIPALTDNHIVKRMTYW
eukprot:Rmarinus@m.10441